MWPSSQASGAEVGRVADSLRGSLDLGHVFALASPGAGGGGGGSGGVGRQASFALFAGNSEYRLCGLICYYGQHYVSCES